MQNDKESSFPLISIILPPIILSYSLPLSCHGTRFAFSYGELNAVRICFCWVGLLAFAVALHAGEDFSSAYINEFMTDNQHGLKDDDGDRSAWIELYNGGPAAINLREWFLTDSQTNLAKWHFPEVVLLPDKYMVVFASARNRTNNLAH